MHIWQVQEAKAKLTQFINDAKDEPQIISRRGEPEIIAMSISRYNELVRDKSQNSLVDFMRNSPLYGLRIDSSRDKSKSRRINL